MYDTYTLELLEERGINRDDMMCSKTPQIRHFFRGMMNERTRKHTMELQYDTDSQTLSAEIPISQRSSIFCNIARKYRVLDEDRNDVETGRLVFYVHEAGSEDFDWEHGEVDVYYDQEEYTVYTRYRVRALVDDPHTEYELVSSIE